MNYVPNPGAGYLPNRYTFSVLTRRDWSSIHNLLQNEPPSPVNRKVGTLVGTKTLKSAYMWLKPNLSIHS